VSVVSVTAYLLHVLGDCLGFLRSHPSTDRELPVVTEDEEGRGPLRGQLKALCEEQAAGWGEEQRSRPRSWQKPDLQRPSRCVTSISHKF
jgi:hypothetical protein